MRGLVLLVLFIGRVAAADEPDAPTPAHDTQILEKLLLGYDSRVRPRGQNKTLGGERGSFCAKLAGMMGPVKVTVNCMFRTISKIDDFNMEYSAQITFREQWVDDRLAYGHLLSFPPNTVLPAFVVLPQTSSDKKQEIWMPDTFFGRLIKNF